MKTIKTNFHHSRCGSSLAVATALCLTASSLHAATFGQFTYKDNGTLMTITGYPQNAKGPVVIPATIAGKPVTSIGKEAFLNCTGLTSVSIGTSVTSIGDRAFYKCDGLTSIIIPSSVTSIGDGAFNRCYGLIAITVNALNPAYGSADGILFNYQKTTIIQYPPGKTGSYTIPSSVTSIGGGAFYERSGLTSVTIPDNVTSIGDYAFAYCDGLTSVTIPSSVTAFGHSALYGCAELTEIKVAAGNSIYSSADGVLFNQQKTLIIQFPAGKTGSYTVPSSVTAIKSAEFGFCADLTSITISSGVTSIEDLAFYECTGLTAIKIDAGNSIYSSEDGVLLDQQKSTIIKCPQGKTGRYTVPDSITSIRSEAFANCSRLTSAVFLGNAPFSSTGWSGVFENFAKGFKVFYFKGKTGFTSPYWEGYPAIAVDHLGPEIEVQQPAGNTLLDAKATRNFGKVKTGKGSIAKIFTIKNMGTARLNDLAITTTGNPKNRFIVSSPAKTTLSPGTSTTFKVSFAPAAVGIQNATIHIISNDINENQFDVKVSGQGVP